MWVLSMLEGINLKKKNDLNKLGYHKKYRKKCKHDGTFSFQCELGTMLKITPPVRINNKIY